MRNGESIFFKVNDFVYVLRLFKFKEYSLNFLNEVSIL
jgi:hypothetical protein